MKSALFQTFQVYPPNTNTKNSFRLIFQKHLLKKTEYAYICTTEHDKKGGELIKT
jgi:hypothetical protein